MTKGSYRPPVGAFLYFDMPYCGYGIVVGRERVVNEEGGPVVVTHILWEGNQWSSIEDLEIPHGGDPFWRVILPQLPASTVMYARKVWKSLMIEREQQRDECEGCPEPLLQ